MLNREKIFAALIVFPFPLFLPWPFGQMFYNLSIVLILRQFSILIFVPVLVAFASFDTYMMYNTLLVLMFLLSSYSNLAQQRMMLLMEGYFRLRWILFFGIVIWFFIQKSFGVVLPHQVDQTSRAMWLVTEPSILVIYISILWSSSFILNIRLRFIELVIICFIFITLSKSITVAAACCVLILSQLKHSRLILLPLMISGIVFFFHDRIVSIDDMSFAYLASGAALSSWRNIPDLAIIYNFSELILPNFDVPMRTRISDLVSITLPGFEWLRSTYSIFAAGAYSIGILATVCIYVTATINWRNLKLSIIRLSAILHYSVLFCIFFIPKEYVFVTLINFFAVQHQRKMR